MKYDLKRPCADCPFRTDIKPFLMRERAENIVNEIMFGTGNFPCHKTIDYENSGEDFQSAKGVNGKELQMCAGAMIICEHSGNWGQMLRISMRLGMFDPDKLDMGSPVFECPEDFLESQDDA